MSTARDSSPDLSLLLARSIVKAQERKRSERIWTDRELLAIHEQVDSELWRTAFKGCESK